MNDQLAKWARHKVGQEIKKGRISRPETCQRCGETGHPMKDGRASIQAHHHLGYGKPLDVEWLCINCHRAETPSPYGTRAPAAKVSWAEVDEMRSRYANGELYSSIAKDFSIHPTTAHRIVTYRTWPEHARSDVPLTAALKGDRS